MTFADRASRTVGTGIAQVAFLVFCGIWWLIGLDMNLLTTVLSVLSITITQMILASQNRETEIEHEKLDAIIHGTDADDGLIGKEKE